MENKKSHQSNLENKRVLFFQCGLVMAMALALAAFEWVSPKTDIQFDHYHLAGVIPEQLEIPITKPKPKRPPLPPVYDYKIKDNEFDFTEIEIDINVDDVDIPGNWIYIPEEKEVTEHTPVLWAQEMPKFNGGNLNQFHAYVQSRIIYPGLAQELGIEGTVIINFVVTQTGELIKATIYKSIDPLLDNEALRVINNSPKWEPGRQKGNPVSVQFTIPIHFQLRN